MNLKGLMNKFNTEPLAKFPADRCRAGPIGLAEAVFDGET